MKILYSWDALRALAQPLVVVIGTFDGLHKGHRFLVQAARQQAAKVGGATVILTFDRHPRHALGRADAPPLLASDAERLARLSETGADYLLVFSLTPEFLSTEAEEFARALFQDTQVVAVYVGSNFRFGRGARGTVETLVRLAHRECTTIHALDLQRDGMGDEVLSSTSIRTRVQEGRMEEVTACLGRPFGFTGRVILGDQRGRTLGFPTANLHLPVGLITPPDGVYIMRVRYQNHIYNAIGNIGNNPTFDKQVHRLEVHIFDFDKEIYGEELYVEFLSYLRGEIKFNRLEDLVTQMHADTAKARSYFESME